MKFLPFIIFIPIPQLLRFLSNRLLNSISRFGFARFSFEKQFEIQPRVKFTKFEKKSHD